MRMMKFADELKLSYRIKLLLFRLPTCLDISYFIPQRFTFRPSASPPHKEKIRQVRFIAFAPGYREPK